jgi:opacity protein-like surface antigen
MDLESDDPGLNIGKGWETMLGFSVLGKYPFALKKTFLLFPLAGIEYQVSLIQQRTLSGDGRRYDRAGGLYELNKDGKALNLSDWNSLLIKVGVGADFMLKPWLFIRGEFLYSFRLMTDYERDGLAQMKGTVPNPKLSGLSSGPNLRIGVGWRFFAKEKS